MALQQMDLFGNFPPEPDPMKDKVKKVEKPAVVLTMQELFPPDPPPAPAPIIIEEKKEEESIVFNDGKIKVRIKPKIVKKEGEQEEQKEVTSEIPAPVGVTDIVKKGRGRKSYKDINANTDLIEIPADETLSQKL